MKEMLIAPGVMLLIMGFAVQLNDIAESSSDKVLAYAEDMNLAMDCALAGLPIRECSPELLKTDFSPEINKTISVLNSMQDISPEYSGREKLNTTSPL